MVTLTNVSPTPMPVTSMAGIPLRWLTRPTVHGRPYPPARDAANCARLARAVRLQTYLYWRATLPLCRTKTTDAPRTHTQSGSKAEEEKDTINAHENARWLRPHAE